MILHIPLETFYMVLKVPFIYSVWIIFTKEVSKENKELLILNICFWKKIL